MPSGPHVHGEVNALCVVARVRVTLSALCCLSATCAPPVPGASPQLPEAKPDLPSPWCQPGHLLVLTSNEGGAIWSPRNRGNSS